MTAVLEHASTGARMTAPAGWEVGPQTAHDSTMLALEPARPMVLGPGFRASLVFTAVPTELDFRQWQVNSDLLLPKVLSDYVLLDLERLQVAGCSGGRRLARHVGPGGVDLTMEQWFLLVDGVGITVTATVDSWRYDAVADELCSHALSLQLPG